MKKNDSEMLLTKKYKKRSQLGEVFHGVIKNKGSIIGLILLCVLILAFLGSLFVSFESITQMSADRLQGPSWEHPFGTDNMGRDQFLRVIYGTRYSLAIGFGVVTLSAIVGITLGSIAGYFGGFVESIIMRFSDVLASIPGILLCMVIVTMLGQSLGNLIIAVGVTTTAPFIRISRASVLTVRGNEFVEAAHAIGYSNLRIIFTEVLPNGLSPIIVTFSISMGVAITIAASISFIGFGVPIPYPEWGTMIAAGRETVRAAPWLMTFPGLAIMVIVLSFNLIGDGLRDALDPKLKGRK